MPTGDWMQEDLPHMHVFGHGLPLWLCVVIITAAAAIYVYNQCLRCLRFAGSIIKRAYTRRVRRAIAATSDQLDGYIRTHPRASGTGDPRRQLELARQSLEAGRPLVAAGELAEAQAFLRSRLTPVYG